MSILKRWLGGPVKAAFSAAGYDLVKRNLPSNLPPDFSDAERHIVVAVRPYTLTPPERIVSLCRALEYVVQKKIEGAIAECGVWRGGSMMAAAKKLQQLGRDDFEIYLFDTYEGMTAPAEVDISASGETGKEVLTKDPNWGRASLEAVKANMLSTGYSARRLHFIKGRVEETLPREAPQKIALLRLDTDFYDSTRHELRHLFPRLAPQAPLILDDYGEWHGARRACDEFFSELSDPVLLNRIDHSARLVLKP